MNDNDLKLADDLTHAMNLIKFLPQALNHYTANLSGLRQKLQELDGRTCTGRAHWRDKDKSDKTAKLYILHGTDRACPVHGIPKRGDRLRSYVGNKPDKISEALAAIERETLRAGLQRTLLNLSGGVGYAIFRLEALYRHIEQVPPDRRAQQPGMPFDQSQVATD